VFQKIDRLIFDDGLLKTGRYEPVVRLKSGLGEENPEDYVCVILYLFTCLNRVPFIITISIKFYCLVAYGVGMFEALVCINF
jgi:hypothetical protein